MCDTALPPSYQICETEIDGPNNGLNILSPKLNGLSTDEGRLETYRSWKGAVDPKKLAEAGFYYTQNADIVRCPFCFVEGYKWLPEDNPMDDHLRWSREQRRHCTFLNERRSEHDDSQGEVETPAGRDTCGKYGVEILPCSIPEDNKVNLEKLGVIKVKGPSHPEYVMEQTRLESFKHWPKSLRQKPEDLASAGFYYLGVGDQTLCFHCGGGLKDWEENDDPWEQHAMWFPKCSYLLNKKSIEFVKKFHDKKETEDITLPSTSGSVNVETKVPQSATVSEKKSEDKDQTLCKICFKNELGVVFLPCGHIVACVDCASALSTCAVCRKPLEATVRAFLS